MDFTRALCCWAGSVFKLLPLKDDGSSEFYNEQHPVHGCRNILKWLLASEVSACGSNRSFARIKFGGRVAPKQEHAAAEERSHQGLAALDDRSSEKIGQLSAPALASAFGTALAAPVTKAELGRCSWTLLHTLAAQYPEKPTRQQQKDVKELMAILSRLYPCKLCADHFKEVLRSCPVQARSGAELKHWMCHVHNIVNRSLGKPHFPCQSVDARWNELPCDDGGCEVHS